MLINIHNKEIIGRQHDVNFLYMKHKHLVFYV